MNTFHRYCSQCGSGMTLQQWTQANYCRMCGVLILKDTGGMPVRDRSFDKQKSVMPASAERHLQATREVISNHPILVSVGAIGMGAAGIAVSPLMIVAGQGLMILGGIIAGVSILLNTREYDDLCQLGVRFGLGAVGVGAVVYGSSFVLMGVGGMAVVTGLGLGAYSWVKAITNYRSKQIVLTKPLLLEGGDNECGRYES